jgi:hypothetical protein
MIKEKKFSFAMMIAMIFKRYATKCKIYYSRLLSFSLTILKCSAPILKFVKEIKNGVTKLARLNYIV